MIPPARVMNLVIPPMRKKVAEIKIPKLINTVLKPNTKPIAAKRRVGRAAADTLPGELMPAPPRMLKYEGIRGSTQGERNDNSPAAKARNSESSAVIIIIFAL